MVERNKKLIHLSEKKKKKKKDLSLTTPNIISKRFLPVNYVLFFPSLFPHKCFFSLLPQPFFHFPSIHLPLTLQIIYFLYVYVCFFCATTAVVR